MATDNETCHVFDNLSMKFSCLLYGRSEKQQQYVISLLDDLNNLNYKLPVVTNNNKALLLIHQLCTAVSPSDTEIVEKCCTLIVNLISQQKVQIEGRTLTYTIEWIIQILKQSDRQSTVILQCLECLVRDHVENIQELLSELIGNQGILLKIINENSDQNIKHWAVKCIEAISYKDDSNVKNGSINVIFLETCIKEFLKILLEEKPENCDEILYCKLINSCLRGIQSIILQSTELENFDLGLLLGIAKCYMVYYLYDQVWVKPQKVMASNLSVADIKTNIPKEKKGGKMTKQRKPRKSNSNKKDDNKRNDITNKNNISDNNYTPITEISESTNITISDSDYSDSETGKSNKIIVTQGRVRQAALNLLLGIVKVTDKHVMFGYWSSFFPDGSPSNAYSLNHCLLREPSPRGRIAVLNVISTLLNGSKIYLSQAETSEKTFAFTPFSMVLGAMIQELHKYLCLALKDNSIPVLTQTLKCLSLLVQATPYHRLASGLVTEVFVKVQPFIRHRDTTVQVAALIVLGCLLASEPIVQETLNNLIQNTKITQNNSLIKIQTESDQEIEYAEFSSDEETDKIEINFCIPWLLEKCLINLGAIKTTNKKNDNVPAPVKLESLQVISVMCRNYFKELLAPHIILVAKALEISLSDKYIDLKLHTGRTVDSIGHAMQQYFALTDESKIITIDKGLQFWLVLLNGPLTSLVQTEQNILRSIGCDCLGSIGSDIFENLPKDKQLLIISLLFSCSRDEENSVRAAAVRALAISVLYPSLREDLGFVMDTAEAIIRSLDDTNLTVRIKSSWSLGNLSDALVLYQNTPRNEELPDSLLYQLISASIKISDDNNKIKCNATRALGNLLRLISIELLQNINYKINPSLYDYKEITEKAIEILVKNSTNCPDMKVRWNSCYAIGNFMKNNDLFKGSTKWQHNVYTALMDLVANFRNFKVRINAALALSVPEKRSHYGIYYFPIWKSLLTAIDNSQNNEDFNEFRHRDNLVDQICLSISHLITFLIKEDLKTLHEILVYHSDSLKTNMYRVQGRLVPEKAEILLRAANHIKLLQQLQNLSENERDVVNLLKHIYDQSELLIIGGII